MTDPHELDAARASVVDAATVTAGLWLSYIFALFYIGIAAAGVTHNDLLLGSPMRLPFIQIEVPLVAFFVLAPLLFIILHIYTLVHFVMLAAKAEALNTALKEQPPDAFHTAEGVRRQLPSNIFVQFLAGPADIREGGLGIFLRIVAWSTLVIGPILLLLLLQGRFLPFHHEWITWLHRLAVFVDVIMLWLLWPAILKGRSNIVWISLRRYKWAALAGLTTLCFAFAVATFPGETIAYWLGEKRWIPPNPITAWLGQTDSDGQPIWTSFHDLFFRGEIDQTKRRRKGFFSDTLVVSHFVAEGTAVLEAAVLRGRDLKGAVFLNADLHEVDLTGALLQGAQLAGARLQGATLDGAQLQGAKLDWAHLQGASLNYAQLQGAWLKDAKLQGATLTEAQAQGAWLEGAQLQGATLENTSLQGAMLKSAHLQGARFLHAHLQGASLEQAIVSATDLTGAYLWRAQLDPKSFKNIFAEETIAWSAEDGEKPWTGEDFSSLKLAIETDTPKTLIEKEPKANLRDLALERIDILDPLKQSAEDAQATVWKKSIEVSALRQKKAYQEALANELEALVCLGDAQELPQDQEVLVDKSREVIRFSNTDAIYFVRELINNGQIEATGPQAKRLVEAILAQNCALSSALPAGDRAALSLIAANTPSAQSSPEKPRPQR